MRYILRRISAAAVRGRSMVATLMLPSRSRRLTRPGLTLGRVLYPTLFGAAEVLAHAPLVVGILGLARLGEPQPLHLLGVADLEQPREDLEQQLLADADAAG